MGKRRLGFGFGLGAGPGGLGFTERRYSPARQDGEIGVGQSPTLARIGVKPQSPWGQPTKGRSRLSSSRAIDRRWTASGPSAMRRLLAHT
jgi:hypothetical protein